MLVSRISPAPRFSASPEHLSNVGSGLGRREAFERFVDRIEFDDRVGDPFGEPDLVLVVDMDRIAAGAGIAGKKPRLPGLGLRIIAADLAGLPEADPEQALGIRPHPARADALLRRFDDRDIAVRLVDPAEMIAGEPLRTASNPLRNAPANASGSRTVSP